MIKRTHHFLTAFLVMAVVLEAARKGNGRALIDSYLASTTAAAVVVVAQGNVARAWKGVTKSLPPPVHPPHLPRTPPTVAFFSAPKSTKLQKSCLSSCLSVLRK